MALTRTLKDFGKTVLPSSWIFLYHSVRISWRLGIMGTLLRTLPNSAQKVRLGGEGGWNVPRSLLRESSICYCVGCGEDITFDLELLRTCSCTVFAFDPTPRAIAHVRKHAAGIPNYKFQTFAIWDREEIVKFYVPPEGVSHSITNLEGTNEYIEVPAKRLKQVMESNGHTAISLLKMDIEGAEHTVIRTIVEDRLQIGVICIEFDELARHGTPDRLASIHRSIQSLLDVGYRYFWIEGSNFTFVR